MLAAGSIWIAMVGFVVYNNYATQVFFSNVPGTKLEFTSLWAGNIAFLLFWFALPLCLVIFFTWWEAPLLRAGRTFRYLLLLLLSSCMVAKGALLTGLGVTRMEHQQQLNMGGYRLTVVRLGCGATCADDVIVRQEWPFVPGVVRARRVGWFHHHSVARLTALRSTPTIDSVQVRISSHTAKSDGIDTTLAVTRVP